MARSGHNGGVALGPLKPAELAVRVRRLPLQPTAEKEICDVSAPQSVSTCFSTPS